MTSDAPDRPTLGVMADYECNPLWLPATFDNPSPAEVGGRFTVRFKPWSRPEVVLS